MRILRLAFLLVSFSALAQQPPAAVTTDLPRDAIHPARIVEMRLTSHGAALNGVFYLAAGAGAHPTVLLLHGFPGYEQNMDLAQSLRRAGWNVLTFHYRGNWGSEGDFSFQNSLDDTDAVLTWLESHDTAAKYGVDPKRIVLIGHSMGGFIAMHVGARHPEVIGIVAIAPWDLAADSANWQGAHRAQALKGFAQEIGPLHGTSPEKIVEESTAHEKDWGLVALASEFKDRPFLLVWGTHDDPQDALRDALAKNDRQLSAITMDTDHGFSDHRIALQAAIINWLLKLR
jgi:uncharacterized protein